MQRITVCVRCKRWQCVTSTVPITDDFMRTGSVITVSTDTSNRRSHSFNCGLGDSSRLHSYLLQLILQTPRAVWYNIRPSGTMQQSAWIKGSNEMWAVIFNDTCCEKWHWALHLSRMTVEHQCVGYDSFHSPVSGASIASSLIPHTGPNLWLMFPPWADAQSLSFRLLSVSEVEHLGGIPFFGAISGTNYSNWKLFHDFLNACSDSANCKDNIQLRIHEESMLCRTCAQATHNYQAASVLLGSNLKMEQLISQ